MGVADHHSLPKEDSDGMIMISRRDAFSTYLYHPVPASFLTSNLLDAETGSHFLRYFPGPFLKVPGCQFVSPKLTRKVFDAFLQATEAAL